MYAKGRWLALALAASCGLAVAQERGARSGDARLAAEPKPIAIPFELSSNKPFVRVRVNDSEPLWFIFDTGNVGGFCIDRRRAATLKLELESEREVHTGAGEGVTVKIALTKGVAFRVGPVRCPDQTATVVPLDHVAAYEGRAVDGLVGRSFISRFVAEIDYASTTIRLHDPDTFEYSGLGRAVPIGLLDGLITTRASVKLPGRAPLEGTFAIDTGSRLALVFNRPFVERHKLLEGLPRAYAATIGGGAGGECKGYVGRLESMQWGPFLLRRPVATFSQDRAGVLASSAFAGIIGGPVLRRCKVFFDYQHKRLILEPYARAPAPYEYDMSGLFLTAKLPDFKQFVVMSVMADSPAAQAGMRRGDVITTINGRPVSEYALEQVRRLFRQAGQECALEVQRGAERVRVKLKLRRLI